MNALVLSWVFGLDFEACSVGWYFDFDFYFYCSCFDDWFDFFLFVAPLPVVEVLLSGPKVDLDGKLCSKGSPLKHLLRDLVLKLMTRRPRSGLTGWTGRLCLLHQTLIGMFDY